MEIYRDDRFDPAFTKDLILLLHADSHALQYVVVHANSGEVYVLADQPLPPSGNGTSPLVTLMNQTDELHVPYKAIHLGLSTAPFLLQPQASETAEITANPILPKGNNAAWEIQTVTQDIQTVFNSTDVRLPISELPVEITHMHHIINGLIPTIEAQQWEGDHITVMVTHRQMIIVGFKNSAFCFANTFHFNSKEDFIYYLMLTAEQLDLDQETCTVHLCGALTPDAQITREIHKFFRHYCFESFGISRLFAQEVNADSLPIAMPVLALLPCV